MMDGFNLVWAWMGIMLFVLGFVYFLYIVGEVWQRIKEYEAMRARGYTLMKSDKGDDFWVGYGD
jgi:Na+-transporting methylmalonyl-CoA/oxaloacetate decarboxylase gamma subunit